MKRSRKTIRKPETLGKKRPHYHFDDSVDLHGFTVQEALLRLESEILNSSIHTLLVIHGKGTGTLKREVRKYLKSNHNVKRVEFGENVNLPGLDGVTLVHLV